MFVANTVNVGADLGAVAAAGGLLTRGHVHPAWLVVPVALLIGFMQLRLAYATIFRVFKLLTLALFAYVITVIVVHPPLLETLRSTFVPHVEFNKDFIGIVVAILGTTISPYLFFWQASSEVEEMKAAGAHTEQKRRGVTRKELRAARIDVFIGMLFSQLVMYCIILTSGSVIHASGNTNIQTRAAGRRRAAAPGRPLRVRAVLRGHDRHRPAGHPRPHRQRRLRRQGVLRLSRQPRWRSRRTGRRSTR